jgi:hypothetical protein
MWMAGRPRPDVLRRLQDSFILLKDGRGAPRRQCMHRNASHGAPPEGTDMNTTSTKIRLLAAVAAFAITCGLAGGIDSLFTGATAKQQQAAALASRVHVANVR